MKTIKKTNVNGSLIILESVSNKKGTTLGYMISKFDNGSRRYLSAPLNMTEAEEHLEFFTNAYKA